MISLHNLYPVCLLHPTLEKCTPPLKVGCIGIIISVICHKGTLIMIRSGSLCFALRLYSKPLVPRDITTSRKLYTEKLIPGRVILLGIFDDGRGFLYLLRTFCSASGSWISIVGGSQVMIPDVSSFFSSLCREERDTFITIAQLEIDSGIRTTFFPVWRDCINRKHAAFCAIPL